MENLKQERGFPLFTIHICSLFFEWDFPGGYLLCFFSCVLNNLSVHIHLRIFSCTSLGRINNSEEAFCIF